MRTLVTLAVLAAACGNEGGTATDAATDRPLIDPTCPGASVPGLALAVRRNGVCDYVCAYTDASTFVYCTDNDAAVGACYSTQSPNNCGGCGRACPTIGGVQQRCGPGGQCVAP